MINLDILTEEHKGRYVDYKDGTGDIHRGRIKSWNDKYIFVVYNCADDWPNYWDYTASATRPEDLRFRKTRDGEDNIKSRFDILDIRKE